MEKNEETKSVIMGFGDTQVSKEVVIIVVFCGNKECDLVACVLSFCICAVQAGAV